MGQLVELNDKDINRKIHYFQIIPPPKGIVLLYEEKLFKHMINFRNLPCIKDRSLEPSKYLNIEISNNQLQNLNVSEQDLKGSIFFQYAMQKSNRKLATRKLNMIANMIGHFSVLTSEENLKRATEDMQLAATYEDITERQKNSIP